MQLLPIPFAILSLCGFWRPVNWSSMKTEFFYSCFTAFMSFLILTFTLSEIMDIFFTVSDLDTFAGNSFMMLSMINVCFKMTCALLYRSDIIGLINKLQKDPFKPRDMKEQAINAKFNQSARTVTIYYAILTETTIITITLRSFVNAAKGILPFRAWLPYNCESAEAFWPTFLHQTIAHVAGGSIQVGNESWIVGMMLQISAHLKILEYRLINVPEIIKRNSNVKPWESYHQTKIILRDCIRYHKFIINFAESLNRIISLVIFVQFSVSSLIICLSVYLLSKLPFLSAPFMSLLLYVSCMLYQIFLYCWYGNEVILQSTSIGNISDKINWILLDNKNRKYLIMLILRTLKPIKFSSNYLVSLSLQSYTGILKTAYSVFNVLQ